MLIGIAFLIILLVWVISEWAKAVSSIWSFRKRNSDNGNYKIYDRIKPGGSKGICRVVIDIDKYADKEFQKFLKEKWTIHILYIERYENVPLESYRHFIDFLSVVYADSFLEDLKVALPVGRHELKWRELI